jgi:hypothetical protein
MKRIRVILAEMPKRGGLYCKRVYEEKQTALFRENCIMHGHSVDNNSLA